MKRWIAAAILLFCSAAAAQFNGCAPGFCAPGASFVGPGDAVSGATAFYGLRAYNASYATGSNPAITIRRTSDSTTSNINILSNGNLDVATATTFCNATTCFVSQIFDQVSTHHLTQATTSAQPALTFNCLGALPCLTYASASSQNLAGTFVTPAQPATFSFVAERTGAATFGTVVGSASTIQAGFANVAGQAYLFAGTTQVVTASDNALHAIQAVFNGASSTMSVDGVLSGSLAAGANGVGTPLNVGGASGNFFNGLFTEGIVYSSGLSSGNQTTLCHNQRLYWGSGGSC